ncbi:MAG: hypothetical protein K2V38_15540 [Gemmataceae bacterium]|nr:hypothetical protein [Gemmataceae bacterium]
MSGKFLTQCAIVDLVKGEHRTNARRKREGLTRHPVTGFSCGCPDPCCGGWFSIVTERTIPTPEECESILARDNQTRKPPRASRPQVRNRKKR